MIQILSSTAVAPAPASAGAAWERPSARPSDEPASWVSLSPHAQMLLQLQQIAESHPPSARGLLGDVAAKMRSDAAVPGREFLVKLAEQVQQASDTGDLTHLAALGEVPVTEAPAAARAVGVAAYARTMEAAHFAPAVWHARLAAVPSLGTGRVDLAPRSPISAGVAAYQRAMQARPFAMALAA